MSTAIAKNLMAEMKLLGMFAAYDQAVTDATRDQTGYSEFLDTLLQAETDYRQERKTGYRIKSARFTLRPAFEDINFTASRSISKSTVFTTQLPLDHWSEVIADPVIADAIRDRLEHAALLIQITGESYRGVKARKLASKKKEA